MEEFWLSSLNTGFVAENFIMVFSVCLGEMCACVNLGNFSASSQAIFRYMYFKQTELSFVISVCHVENFPCREFRKKMEVAKARVHAVKKKQKEAEKTAEVVNVTQTSNKRQVKCRITCWLFIF